MLVVLMGRGVIFDSTYCKRIYICLLNTFRLTYFVFSPFAPAPVAVAVCEQGTLTVVGESETMVRASMDAECNVSMDAHAPLGMPGLAGKLTVHQGKNDLIQGTALFLGEELCRP